MKKIQEIINDAVKQAFVKSGYSAEYGATTISNRPDLCQYQCNGALTAAKEYKKAPIIIATEVSVILSESPIFKEVKSIQPGFINMVLDDLFMTNYIMEMMQDGKYGCDEIGHGQTIIVDYGGPNVAKPLHVGHLRTANIGESIKRLGKFLGYHMLGDVHLGDWGLQIGLIIAELQRRNPELIYFDDSYTGAYPTEAPFTITDLEEIYPTASQFAKETPWFMEKAKETTYLFQSGHPGYVHLWKHILEVSIKDLKHNYANLNVYFELWKKESDVQPYIPEMIDDLKDKELAYLSDGALVVDVRKPSDNKEMPPCILVKSDGATLYGTTDLATILERMDLYDPDEIIYIVDKRQEMHFEQVFRCARKGDLVPPTTKLTFLGFGTMNGKDGKPFKTRDGGVMRLEHLLKNVCDKVYNRVSSNDSLSESERVEISNRVGLAALKYGDLSNQISKDYIFDLERFTSFEGNTGPYILYTVVRVNSILTKFHGLGSVESTASKTLQLPINDSERDLMLKLVQFNNIITTSFLEYAPQKVCHYLYELSNLFNKFYQCNKILTEENKKQQLSWIQLITLTKDILNCGLDLLGIEAPDKM